MLKMSSANSCVNFPEFPTYYHYYPSKCLFEDVPKDVEPFLLETIVDCLNVVVEAEGVKKAHKAGAETYAIFGLEGKLCGEDQQTSFEPSKIEEHFSCGTVVVNLRTLDALNLVVLARKRLLTPLLRAAAERMELLESRRKYIPWDLSS